MDLIWLGAVVIFFAGSYVLIRLLTGLAQEE
jgi:hypothetical protein